MGNKIPLWTRVMKNWKGSLIPVFLLSICIVPKALCGEMQLVFIAKNKDTETCKLTEIGWARKRTPLVVKGQTYWNGNNGCTVTIPRSVFNEHWQFCSLAAKDNPSSGRSTCSINTPGEDVEFTEFSSDGFTRCTFSCLTR
ncbi:hypothetical protein IZS59_001863 [Vibrio cholerae]|nr:hypothetical protein [Vibrio cholerae]